jgi:hypothetical protein
LQWEKFRALGAAALRAAVVDEQPIGLPLALSVFKSVTKEPVTFSDLEREDPDAAQALRNLGVSLKGGGGMSAEELGEDEEAAQAFPRVDEGNFKEYLDFVATRALAVRRHDALSAFAAGFKAGLTASLDLKKFTAQRLQEDVCGSVELEGGDVFKMLIFEGYPPASSTPGDVRDALKRMGDEELRLVLHFVTGRGVPPAECMHVVNVGGGGALPVAHTCSKTLELPDYSDGGVLEAKLRRALEETYAGFQIA